MSENDHQPKPDVPEPWRPRFGVGALLMVMLVCSVTGAAGYYLVRSIEDEKNRTAHLTFILFTLAAPILLMVVVSAIRQIIVWLSRR